MISMKRISWWRSGRFCVNDCIIYSINLNSRAGFLNLFQLVALLLLVKNIIYISLTWFIELRSCFWRGYLGLEQLVCIVWRKFHVKKKSMCTLYHTVKAWYKQYFAMSFGRLVLLKHSLASEHTRLSFELV